MMDEEKWINIINNSENYYREPDNIIKLNKIVVLPQVNSPRRPRKILKYFIKDEHTTLSDEDMYLQMSNFTDILETKPLLPQLLEKDFRIK